MSEEEVIETVNNFIDGYRQYNPESGETIIPYKYGEGQKFCYVEDFEAIQGLLDLYKQEKEKNKELEEKLKIATAMLTRGTYPEQNEGDNDFDKQFISKDKIRKKIKILKEEREECNDSILASKLLGQIYLLQELSEEK